MQYSFVVAGDWSSASWHTCSYCFHIPIPNLILLFYSPNSYRVISFEAEQTVPNRAAIFKPPTESNVIGQVPEPGFKWDHRNNRPNATHVGFLSQDVKLLNEPVCDVHTKATKAEQNAWWPHRVSEDPHKVPGHPLHTTVREDFQYRGKEVSRSSRHAANPNKKPAYGSGTLVTRLNISLQQSTYNFFIIRVINVAIHCSFKYLLTNTLPNTPLYYTY